MNSDTRETTDEFHAWLKQQRMNLPLSAPFWDIQAVYKTDKSADTVRPIILKQHGAVVMKTVPFYKPYSKLVRL